MSLDMTALLHLQYASDNTACHQISSTITEALNGLIRTMRDEEKAIHFVNTASNITLLRLQTTSTSGRNRTETKPKPSYMSEKKT